MQKLKIDCRLYKVLLLRDVAAFFSFIWSAVFSSNFKQYTMSCWGLSDEVETAVWAPLGYFAGSEKSSVNYNKELKLSHFALCMFQFFDSTIVV